MNASGQTIRKFRQIRASYDRLKVAILRLLLVTLLVLLISAQIFSPVAEFLIQRRFFTFAVVVGVVLTLLDVILSSGELTKSSGDPTVLNHFSDLREHLNTAFDSESIEISISAYSGETFYNLLSEFLQDVADGRRKPKRLYLRLLVPDCSAPMTIPCVTSSLHEVPEYKVSLQARNNRFEGEFRNHFSDIQRRARFTDAQFEVRIHRIDPLFKVILINNASGFFSIYPIAETAVQIAGAPVQLWDYRGERAHFVGFASNGGPAERELFSTLTEWFRVMWYNISVAH